MANQEEDDCDEEESIGVFCPKFELWNCSKDETYQIINQYLKFRTIMWRFRDALVLFMLVSGGGETQICFKDLCPGNVAEECPEL